MVVSSAPVLSPAAEGEPDLIAVSSRKCHIGEQRSLFLHVCFNLVDLTTDRSTEIRISLSGTSATGV